MKDLLKYKDYVATIQFSAEDEIFYGKIQGIEDLVTFEGHSVASLKKAFREAVDDYITLCMEAGKSPVKSYKGTFNVRIHPELHREAAHKSLEMGTTLNQIVEEAIRVYLMKGKK